VSDRIVAMHDVISQPPLDQQKLRALLEAAERLTSTLSRDDVLNHILAIGGELTASEAGSVILYDPDQNNLYFAAATGPSAEQVRALRIPIGKGKAGMVFETA
jgi:GAF domain-containing protein